MAVGDSLCERGCGIGIVRDGGDVRKLPGGRSGVVLQGIYQSCGDVEGEDEVELGGALRATAMAHASWDLRSGERGVHNPEFWRAYYYTHVAIAFPSDGGRLWCQLLMR